jgi:glycine cleavage system regulatory protein
MPLPLVMTIVAPDRPGLVESIAAVVAENGGNWLESRMSRLGGQFAGILRLEIAAEKRDQFLAALHPLETAGIKLVVQADELDFAPSGDRVAELTLVGQDRPGIVRQISRAFARHGLNVEELSTECSSAPMSGETLFHATARVQIPSSCRLPELQEELERIAADLMVDVKLEELSASARS